MWIQTDENNRVIATCSEELTDGFEIDTDITFEEFTQHPLGWRYIDGKLVYDEQTDTERKAELTNLIEIGELKEKLNQTDYAVIKSIEAIFSATTLTQLLSALRQGATEYKKLLADRKTWRERIQELE